MDPEANTLDTISSFRSFFDLVEGIEDPDVFIPPSFCDSVEMLPAKEGLVTNSFIGLL